MPASLTRTSAERAAARETSKILRLGAPWAWLVASFPAALVVRVLGGGEPLGAAALTLATVAVTGLTWLVTRDHGPMTAYPAVATAGASGLWLVSSAIFGIPALWLPWLLIALVLAVGHNIIAVFHRGGQKDSPQKLLGSMLGLPGSPLALEKTPDGTAATGTWDTVRGEQTAQDAQQRRGLLASAAGVSPEDITINTSSDYARAPVRIQLVDVLKNRIPWPGPGHPGAMPTEPIALGKYRDNSPAAYRVITAEHGARHGLFTGTSGSGKTTAARVVFCELATRRQTNQIVIDTLKAAQSLGCVRAGLDLVIDRQSVAERLFAGMPRYIQRRSEHLGALGLDNWAPDCGLNFVNLHIEEAHRFADASELAALTVALRSVGVALSLSVQRPVYTQLNTTVRAQLTNLISFGLNDDADARIALGDDAVNAGADPSIWGNRVPGMAYAIHPDTDSAHQYMQLRGFDIRPEQAEAHMRLWAPRRDPLDDLTAEMLPEMLGTKTTIPLGTTRPQSAATALATEFDDEPTTPDPAPEIEVDLNAPLPELPDGPLGDFEPPAPARMSADEAREALLDAIREIVEAPESDGYFNPGQLHFVATRARRSRTWIYEACRALARDEILTEHPSGGYRLNEPVGASA